MATHSSPDPQTVQTVLRLVEVPTTEEAGEQTEGQSYPQVLVAHEERVAIRRAVVQTQAEYELIGCEEASAAREPEVAPLSVGE